MVLVVIMMMVMMTMPTMMMKTHRHYKKQIPRANDIISSYRISICDDNSLGGLQVMVVMVMTQNHHPIHIKNKSSSCSARSWQQDP